MMKYSILVAALAALTLTACEGKKSLDGHPMDKPPPSAYAPRDAEVQTTPSQTAPTLPSESHAEEHSEEAGHSAE